MPGTDVSGSFTAGLISSLDAVFDMPLEELLASLPLSEELKAAIVRREGLVGEILECAIAVERAQWDAIHCGELTPEEIRQAYLWAITEVNALWSSFDA
jgi:EAL and modified HD-GYP domain-containing signal transduction protein